MTKPLVVVPRRFALAYQLLLGDFLEVVHLLRDLEPLSLRLQLLPGLLHLRQGQVLLLLVDLLHQRQVPVEYLGRLAVAPEARIRLRRRDVQLVMGLGEAVVGRTRRQLDHVDVAVVGRTVVTATRRVDSRRVPATERVGQTLAMMPVRNDQGDQTQPVQDRGVAVADGFEVFRGQTQYRSDEYCCQQDQSEIKIKVWI